MQRPFLFLATSLLLSCSTADGHSCDPAADPLPRSLCLKASFDTAPPATEAAAYTAVSEIPDPLTRQVVIESWLKGHPGITPNETIHLCTQLPQLERPACERHGNAAHLKR